MLKHIGISFFYLVDELLVFKPFIRKEITLQTISETDFCKFFQKETYYAPFYNM